MCKSRFTASILAATMLFSAGILSAAQSEERFRTRLAPVAMDIAMRANIAGSGTASASLQGEKLTVTGSFEGLLSNATGAQLRLGPAAGVPGKPVFDINVPAATSGTFSASFDLTPEQVEAVRKGKFYVQIASQKAPDGNLWGWLMNANQERH